MQYIFISFLTFLIASTNLYSQVLSWTKINNEQYIFDMKMNARGDIFYSAQSIWGITRSTDYGASWEQIYLPDYIGKIAINDSGFIFAAADFTSLIFRSTDNGNTWTEFNTGHRNINCLTIGPEGNIYAGNEEGYFIKSSDDGISWESFSITNKEIETIATASNGQIFVGTYGDCILTSGDYGTSWKRIVNDTLGSYVFSIAISKKDIIYAINDINILISTNFGESWYLSEHFDFSQRVLAFDSLDNLYLGNNSVYKSADNGLTWNDLGCPDYISSIVIYDPKIYVSTFSGIFLYDPDIPPYIGSNYFPLNIGNTWQYKTGTTFIDVVSYSIETTRIERDTVINNTRYYKYRNQWMRYSEPDKKLYMFWNDSDKVFMDFNLFSGARFQQFYYGQYRTALIKEGTSTIFNTPVKYKGYSANIFFEKNEEWFAENLGPVMSSYENTQGPDYYSRDNIIMAELFDSTNIRTSFTNNYKPEILFTPITEIDTNVMDISFNVDHPYSEFFSVNTPHHSLNFTDSVYILFYYSSRDSSTEISKSDAVNVPRTYSYSASINLNTELLKDGYIFNYKITAKDKGIIREEAYVPDSGFYQCSWSGPTNLLDGKYTPNEFSLSQNYPNPFNPVTKIKYAIGSRQYAILKICDILGNEIVTLVNEEKPAGEYVVEFDASNLASGIYFYELNAGSFRQAKKLLLLK